MIYWFEPFTISYFHSMQGGLQKIAWQKRYRHQITGNALQVQTRSAFPVQIHLQTGLMLPHFALLFAVGVLMLMLDHLPAGEHRLEVGQR